MRYSSLGLFLLISSFAISTGTSGESVTFHVLNGGTNTVSLSNSFGVAAAGAGLDLQWSGQAGETVYVTNGANLCAFNLLPSHALRVYAGVAQSLMTVDETVSESVPFWTGFAFSFCLGLGALGSRWAQKTIGGGYNE